MQDAPAGLSIVQLIESGTVDARTAALAWLTLERHGSVLIAAVPRRAGKSTLLDALLDLLPPAGARVHLAGDAETFAFERETTPGDTLLLANELSSHLPIYLWGAQALRAFAAVGDGYAIAGTLHADSAGDAIALLRDECGIPAMRLARIDLVVVIGVTAEGERITARRVTGAYRTVPATAGPDTAPLVTWDPTSARWEHDRAAEAALAGPDLDARAAFLRDLTQRGIRANSAVRAALAEFHAGTMNGVQS